MKQVFNFLNPFSKDTKDIWLCCVFADAMLVFLIVLTANLAEMIYVDSRTEELRPTVDLVLIGSENSYAYAVDTVKNDTVMVSIRDNVHLHSCWCLHWNCKSQFIVDSVPVMTIKLHKEYASHSIKYYWRRTRFVIY